MDTIEKDITEILYNLRRIREKNIFLKKTLLKKWGQHSKLFLKSKMVTLLFVLFTPIAEQLE